MVTIALLNKLEILRGFKITDWSPNEVAYYGIDYFGWKLSSAEVIWLCDQLG